MSLGRRQDPSGPLGVEGPGVPPSPHPHGAYGLPVLAQETGGSDLGWEKRRDRKELIWGRGSSTRRPSVKAAFRAQWQQSWQWPGLTVVWPQLGLLPWDVWTFGRWDVSPVWVSSLPADDICVHPHIH